MNFLRHPAAAAVLAVLFLNFGCEQKPEKAVATAQLTNNVSAPTPVATIPSPSNVVAISPPIYVPDISHANDPLPDGILAWDTLMQATNAAADQPTVQFAFNFTNVAEKIDIGLATNVTAITNFTTVTNSSFWASLWGNKIIQVATVTINTNVFVATNSVTPLPVTILDAKGSCSCTTAELPSKPWAHSARHQRADRCDGQPCGQERRIVQNRHRLHRQGQQGS